MRVRTLVSDCDIRSGTAADAADVVYLTQRAYAEPCRAGAPVFFIDEDEQSLLRDLAAGWCLIIAHHGGLAVGGVRWRCDAGVVRLRRLAVEPRYRRRGIGSALVRAVEQAAAGTGAQTLVGEVPAEPELVAFFARHGFVPRAERVIGPLRFLELAKGEPRDGLRPSL
jgi:GNAT superfamily N-acetyltransferase